MIYWKLNNFLSILEDSSGVPSIGHIDLVVHYERHIGRASGLGLCLFHLPELLQVLLTFLSLQVGVHLDEGLL